MCVFCKGGLGAIKILVALSQSAFSERAQYFSYGGSVACQLV